MSEPLLVNKSELARMLRISQPTIDTMIADGCPVHRGGSNGVPYEFDFYAVTAWRKDRDTQKAADEAVRQQRINAAQSELFSGQQLAPQGIDNIRQSLDAERLATYDVQFNYVAADANGQDAIVEGTVLTFKLYPLGDGTAGNKYYGGTGIVETVTLTGPLDGKITGSATFRQSGAPANGAVPNP